MKEKAYTLEPWDTNTVVKVEGDHPLNPSRECFRPMSEVNYWRAVECVNALAGIKNPKIFVEIGKSIIADNDLTEDKLADIRKVLEGKMNWKNYCAAKSGFEMPIDEKFKPLAKQNSYKRP